MDNIEFKKSFLNHQLEALKNDKFSILLVDRTKEKSAFVYNNSICINDINDSFDTLSSYNSKGFDIYIKSEEGDFFNIIIDDLTLDKAKLLLDEYYIDYMVYSSNDNFQAIINLSKTTFTKEQADFIVRTINKKYGDHNFSGANHYFRLCGFNNKKQKNDNEVVTPVSFKNKIDKQASINKLFAFSKQINNKAKNDIEIDILTAETLNNSRKTKAANEVRAEISLCKKTFQDLDWSVVDYRIVKRLYKLNYKPNEIAEALILFTDFQNRHANPVDYLNRTITNAIQEIQEKK